VGDEKIWVLMQLALLGFQLFMTVCSLVRCLIAPSIHLFKSRKSRRKEQKPLLVRLQWTTNIEFSLCTGSHIKKAMHNTCFPNCQWHTIRHCDWLRWSELVDIDITKYSLSRATFKMFRAAAICARMKRFDPV
jgi:hypothetical protein